MSSRMGRTTASASVKVVERTSSILSRALASLLRIMSNIFSPRSGRDPVSRGIKEAARIVKPRRGGIRPQGVPDACFQLMSPLRGSTGSFDTSSPHGFRRGLHDIGPDGPWHFRLRRVSHPSEGQGCQRTLASSSRFSNYNFIQRIFHNALGVRGLEARNDFANGFFLEDRKSTRLNSS